MALSTYAELQIAVRDELDIESSGLPDASIVDAINRAESRMNRKLRLREMEQLATTTLEAGNSFVDLPDGFIENVSVDYKQSTESDVNYRHCQYVDPVLLQKYQNSSRVVYTLRDQFEFAPIQSTAITIRMHYMKRWDLAADSTNWLLTTHPDVYFYGSLSELERTVRNDARMPIWRADFEAAIEELNEVAERGRDDARLITDEIASMSNRGNYSILTGGY